ncbi:dipeptide transport system permease protein [Kushneria avicenniae]|uniref:Dipeptide transport system permease protein n=1 Tax=Kushneria avicenniae TaxID=402385 RepID=A0A1I1KWP0_9GAMM|nr:ABC transporter permease subunit [Kushneria avicenniae]SFC65226.1 dipeptide transport system permease protein [Kushneria avicenniae]
MTQVTPQPPAATPGIDDGAPAEQTAKRPSPLRDVWRSFRRNRAALVGMVIIALIVVIACLADVVAPYSPVAQFRDSVLTPPFWQDGGSLRFVLGTDDLGRDILSRLIHGARLSMTIGVIVVSLSLGIGVLLGLLAGFLRGWIDTVIMRLMDIMLSIPSLLLAVVVVAVLGPGLFNAMLAIAVVYLPHYVRLTRSSVITEREREYVMASRLAGAGMFRLMFITILPNCLAPLIVQATLSFSNAVLDAAALGFLGLGAQPPTPEWGSMLADARQYVLQAWWVVTFPGLAVLITVLAFNIMGDGLRDALDPRLKR